MNYKAHITHFKGKPLREMSRDECIEALQYYSARYTEERDRVNQLLQRSGRAIIE